MNLKKLKIIDFKKIRSVELDLADVTILVGANGSGKSSIIQAAHFASCLIRQADSVKHDKTAIGIFIASLIYGLFALYLKWY